MHLSGWVTIIIIKGLLFKGIKIQILFFCTFCIFFSIQESMFSSLFTLFAIANRVIIYPFFILFSITPEAIGKSHYLVYLIKWKIWEQNC